MTDILKNICSIPSAPGMEKGLLTYIENEYAKHLQYFLDGMGNLTVVKKCGKEDARKIQICAKTDNDGFIVNFIEENGYLRVTKLGNSSIVSCAYTELVSDTGVHGFFVPEKGAEVKEGDTSKMYIDIGALSRKEAENLVKLGDIFARIPSACRLSGTRCAGSCAASRAPLAMLLKLLCDEKCNDADLYFTFTVQESTAMRGAKTATFDTEPDLCIYIDTCESFDTVGANKRGEAVLSDGAVILSKTSDYCMPPKVRENVIKTALENNIRHKVCVYPDKTCSASVISACGKGNDCIEVCIPARNIGGGAEIFDTSDAEELLKLISAVISQ